MTKSVRSFLTGANNSQMSAAGANGRVRARTAADAVFLPRLTISAVYAVEQQHRIAGRKPHHGTEITALFLIKQNFSADGKRRIDIQADCGVSGQFVHPKRK